MDLRLDEQLLVADFRRLDPGAQKELLDYAAFLLKKKRPDAADGPARAKNQCGLDAGPEERPEAVKEPVFTE